MKILFCFMSATLLISASSFAASTMVSCNKGKIQVVDDNGRYKLLVNGAATGAELTRDVIDVPELGTNTFLVYDTTTTNEMKPNGATHLQIDLKNSTGAISFIPVGGFYQIIEPLEGCSVTQN